MRRGSRAGWPALLAAGALVACSWPVAPPSRFEVDVEVHGDPGQALAGAQIGWRGQALGKTDARGLLGLSIRGREGRRVALTVTCPEGFASPRDPLELALRRVVDASHRPRLRAHCRPTRRRIVVAVRAERGAGLPVRHLGSEVARTDASGAAHVLLELPPGEQFQLQLDTADRPDLAPQSPSAIFEVGDEDALLLFDQPFERVRQRRYRRPEGPQRL